MVQLFYYETRGKNYYRLLKHEGHPSKILLFPYEGWARPACMTYWILDVPWWSKKRCRVVEVCGTKKNTTKAKIVNSGSGDMCVVGRFKKTPFEPDFKLFLTTNVSNADFQLGYSMTGTLERGDRRKGNWQMTHYAMIKRKGY
ncbi:hypothetical protein LSH36_142g02015 [Paralvinella palmiformis]|uniref:Uncharacterized protein n=1 Tax=Paralvinella palmiformis TaxID=53620 RepID=A0AAD9JVL2_9ANNE|nr:hypothetical protein LSH36_142g02015 [Paralvinella palmiformis]